MIDLPLLKSAGAEVSQKYTTTSDHPKGIPVYIEMVKEHAYRSPFYVESNKYLGGTDAEPCIQKDVSTGFQRIDILPNTKGLFIQVPVKSPYHDAAYRLAIALCNVAEAFRRSEQAEPGIVFIDEIQLVRSLTPELEDAFDHAFDCCNSLPERFVIGAQTYEDWIHKALKSHFKVINNYNKFLDNGHYDGLSCREILSNDPSIIQHLFHDQSRIIEDLFQWVSLRVSMPMRCPIPETPIAEKLGLSRWGISGREEMGKSFDH